MEELVKKVEQVFLTFAHQEIGNRLSEFSIAALKGIILNEIVNYNPKEQMTVSRGSIPTKKEQKI